MKKFIFIFCIVLCSLNIYCQAQQRFGYGRVWNLYTEFGISQNIYHRTSTIPYNSWYPYNVGLRCHHFGSKRLKYEFQWNFKYIDIKKMDIPDKTVIYSLEHFSGLRYYPYNYTFRLGKHVFIKPTASASIGVVAYDWLNVDMAAQWTAGFVMGFNNRQSGFTFEIVHRPLSFPNAHNSSLEFYFEPAWTFRIGINMAKY